MPEFPVLSEALKEAVARCMAKQDDRFIGAEDWAGELGDQYRKKADEILWTISKFIGGTQSGGLPMSESVTGGQQDLSLVDELAEALRPFVFDWDQAESEQEDLTYDDMENLELGNVVDRATMERACGALERYERERMAR